MIQYNSEGITPTATFIENLNTEIFQELLPGIFMIKGAKNERGFDQAYMIEKGKKEVILIDVVEEAYREAVENLQSNGFSIHALLITGKAVLNDCYSDLDTISKDFGNAEIYVAPEIAPKNFDTKELSGRDALLSKFDLEAHVVPKKEGQVILYCDKHNGIIFSGDSALGSDYRSDEFIFTRGREQNEKEAFAVEEFWRGFNKDFDYFFPRQGKPALEVDERTRTTLLSRLAKGEAGLE